MSVFSDDLTFRLGEAFPGTVLTITDADGDPSDLTGVALTLVVRELAGGTDLLTVTLTVDADPTTGLATLPGIPATGAESVANLADYSEMVLRYLVADGAGNGVKRGDVYVSPAWSRV